MLAATILSPHRSSLGTRALAANRCPIFVRKYKQLSIQSLTVPIPGPGLSTLRTHPAVLCRKMNQDSDTI